MSKPLTTTASSVSYATGTHVIPANDKRTHFFVVISGGSGSVAFGTSGAQIPLSNGFHYSPTAVPTGIITLVAGAGATAIVHGD